MQEHPLVHEFAIQTIITLRQLLGQPDFCIGHKRRAQDFTRVRRLSFMNTVVLLLQKSVRSLQLRLNEFFERLGGSGEAVSASAWCQARRKLSHSAFIELNRKVILERVYAPDSAFGAERWRGHRLLAIDSSLIHLPNTKAVGREYGWVKCANQKGECGRYTQGRLSVLTDVCNRLALEALLVPWQEGERALAAEHLKELQPGDVALMDRGFAGYELFARFVAAKRHFVCRCSRNTFGAVDRLLAEDCAGQSVLVELRAPNGTVGLLRMEGLPEKISVRLVTVRLSTGELEVLATNLLDEVAYETALFGELYQKRWGVETYFGLLKGRLELENFTGNSVEAVRQEVHATIFLSNLESVVTAPARRRLEQSKPKRQLNQAVCFHALKHRLIELLLSREPPEQSLQKLEQWLIHGTQARRPERQVPRRKFSAWRSYWYQRNARKSVF